MGQGAVADIMGLPYEQVEVWGAGLNHSQCLLQIRDRKTGEDLYPRLREKEKTFDASFLPLTRQVFRAFGYWMTCSDDHFGEYLAYGWEGGEHGYDFAADERGRVEFAAQLDRVLAGAPGAGRLADAVGRARRRRHRRHHARQEARARIRHRL